jgi:hypothetical protein
MSTYKPTSSLVKDENGDQLAESHNILNRWNKYLLHIFNVQRASDVRQIEIQTAEPLVPDRIAYEVEIVIAALKMYESPGSDEIPAEVIQAGGEMLRYEIHKLINYIWNKEVK